MNINRIATAIIVIVVVIAGGIVTVTHPGTLTFSQYIRDVAIAVGLLGIAHGIDTNSTP